MATARDAVLARPEGICRPAALLELTGAGAETLSARIVNRYRTPSPELRSGTEFPARILRRENLILALADQWNGVAQVISMD